VRVGERPEENPGYLFCETRRDLESWPETGAPILSRGKSMTARQFKRQITKLGWSLREAARELGVPAGKARIGEWSRGVREIPPYIDAHMRTLKELEALKARS